MTDPRIEVAARAICDRHNGVWLDGDYDHDNDVWRCDATAALAAADAVDPVRKAARKVCIDSGDWTLGQAIDALGVALAAK